MSAFRALATAAALAAAMSGGCTLDPPDPPPPPMSEGEVGSEGGRAPVRTDGEPRVETVASGLDVPWEIAFLPDGRALITERPGRVRLVTRSGELQREPVAEVSVTAIGEGGLLGAAVDPEFTDNRFVYLYRTTGEGNVVTRYRLERSGLVEDRDVVTGIAQSVVHDGGRLRFGPDGWLYIGTGDAALPSLAQDPHGLNGKILRLSPDDARGRGGRPEVFTLGHRNGQGFDWDPDGGRMVESEHGATGNDEVNVLRRGRNYGWPEIEGSATAEGFESPVVLYEDGIAPSGASFVTKPGSEWSGDFLIAALRGEQIRRVRLDGERATIDEPLFEGAFGRLRTVVEGPDGALYVLTSNGDGRGEPRDGDDRLLRIVPPAG